MMRLIFKTSSVTPDFFYVFNLILSFSTCSESFEKICAWELLGANVLNFPSILSLILSSLLQIFFLFSHSSFFQKYHTGYGGYNASNGYCRLGKDYPHSLHGANIVFLW